MDPTGIFKETIGLNIYVEITALKARPRAKSFLGKLSILFLIYKDYTEHSHCLSVLQFSMLQNLYSLPYNMRKWWTGIKNKKAVI